MKTYVKKSPWLTLSVDNPFVLFNLYDFKVYTENLLSEVNETLFVIIDERNM